MKDLLLIDDDPELAELLGAYLGEEGIGLDAAVNGGDGLDMARRGEYELIILDVMLPDTSGFNVLTKLRGSSNVPVIMLTGRGEEIDRVVGLEMGADDYVSKPFQLRELLARIRAVLRRYGAGGEEGGSAPVAKAKPDIEINDVRLNRNARNLTIGGTPVHLTSTEFDILEMLAVNMGSVVERNALMERALGRSEDFDDYVLNVHMSNLRKKLDRHVGIKTIRGRGYLLTVPQEEAV
ncbi:MAG: response regulator transcription factor [Pseudodesulfovibrio sp.]|jgi:two-component system response regulator CpxR|uniref:Two-component system response regulator n=1 Tax=Pseudodesulfovibrio indicus TaxID=1716143 RepID=A0A126QRI8_9BACT|nr:response regulator transcription factor [Pseudodesulfovibrio indicus]AMK12584.1 two-component system response regulator [Pseudodesulfovibrio indicus]TDT90894.1 winged helix family two component transcriptional regulator [Pseudodesulfovibrio indicus]